MSGDSPVPNGALTPRLEKVLTAFGGTRARLNLAADDALIFLALGHMSLLISPAGTMSRPVACVDVAALLKIPKETVRRKIARLVELDLAAATTRGVFVKNVDEWRALVEQVAG